MRWGDALRAWRVGERLTCEALGELLDVGIANVSRWERGEHGISRELWEKLSALAPSLSPPAAFHADFRGGPAHGCDGYGGRRSRAHRCAFVAARAVNIVRKLVELAQGVDQCS